MKKFALLLLATLLGSFSAPICSLPAFVAIAEEDSFDQNADIVEYDKTGLSYMLSWGIAKFESAFDGQLMNELFSAFLLKCERMFTLMIHSFTDMFMSYDKLYEREVQRLDQFDAAFRELVKLRQKIERRCLVAASEDERTLCVDQGIEVKDKLHALRGQRSKSFDAVGRYERWMTWCSSYKNWFC